MTKRKLLAIWAFPFWLIGRIVGLAVAMLKWAMYAIITGYWEGRELIESVR